MRRDVVAEAAALESVPGARDLGRSKSSDQIIVALVLRYRNEKALDDLLAQQSTPGSGSYHRWLTNEEFTSRFGPSPSDYHRVVRSLRAAGFEVTKTFANRTVVDAAGTIAQIERYFATEMHDVAAGGRTARANVAAASVPAGLRGTVLAVGGLDTLPLVHTFHATAPATRQPSPRRHNSGWPLLGPPGAHGYQGYGPAAYAAAYDFPIRHTDAAGRPYDGTGRATGIAIDADYVDGDLATFTSYFKIKPSGPAVKRILINGGPPPGDEAADSLETTLDVETIIGNAPGTALYVYEMPQLTLKNITDTYNTIVEQNAVDDVNSSFGGCEAAFPHIVKAWDAIAKQGLAKGMTFAASTGDFGGVLCASAPATSPSFVAVGGTSLQVAQNGKWFAESGWGGSGGGVSSVFSRPQWQAGFPGPNNRGRNVPDIALDADPTTGTAFYLAALGGFKSIYNPLGGTSLACPLYIAAITQLDQVAGKRLGADAPKIYNAWQQHGYGSATTPYFHDITQGNSGIFFTATGYDLVTGIGSPDVWNLGKVL
jgi:subtilase family serine protease